MRSILVLNAKGGSGKTTIATNLAGYYANQGKKVVLADFDPQGSSIDWLRQRRRNFPKIMGIEAYSAPLRVPKVADILKVTRLAHEEEYVEKNSVLADGEEYCLIPPVSGG